MLPLAFACIATMASAQTRPDSVPLARLAAADTSALDTTAIAPPVMREFRGVWVATVGNMDWPSRKGLPVAQQQAELIAILDRAAALNLNAIVLQVRPVGDALYASKLEPWSEFLTGQMGKAPEPFYDPLEFAVAGGARARARAARLVQSVPRALLRRTRSRIVGEPHRQATPGPRARATARTSGWTRASRRCGRTRVGVVRDVVRRYDIDGVHIDDYFYPYREHDPATARDSLSRRRGRGARYRAAGGTLGRDDWRARNVDLLVEQLYGAVKQEKPWVKFGISPFGIWRPGYPASVRGLDAYAEIYADSRKWLQRRLAGLLHAAALLADRPRRSRLRRPPALVGGAEHVRPAPLARQLHQPRR